MFLAKLTSTFFYIGYLPAIPGTFASLAALVIIFFIKENTPLYIAALVLSICAGFAASTIVENDFKKKDPKQIVIDEVAGMFLALISLPFYDLRLLLIGFVLFRILDTIKPYPAYSLQKLEGAAGIMIDDLVAGLYTNIILQIVSRLVSCNIS